MAKSLTSSESTVLTYEQCKVVTAPFYCEENVCNILKLALQAGAKIGDLFAVFVSSPDRLVPFREQKSTFKEKGGMCYWDYHVIPLILTSTRRNSEKTALVYDVDSVLPFPSSLQHYVTHSIPAPFHGMDYQQIHIKEFRHCFRVVNYGEVMTRFSSDRRHMLLPASHWREAGVPEYTSVPPPWPCFKPDASSHPHSLHLFLKMDAAMEDDLFKVNGELSQEEAPGELFCCVEDLFKFFDRLIVDPH